MLEIRKTNKRIPRPPPHFCAIYLQSHWNIQRRWPCWRAVMGTKGTLVRCVVDEHLRRKQASSPDNVRERTLEISDDRISQWQIDVGARTRCLVLVERLTVFWLVTRWCAQCARGAYWFLQARSAQLHPHWLAYEIQDHTRLRHEPQRHRKINFDSLQWQINDKERVCVTLVL